MASKFMDDKHVAGTLLEAEALLHACGQPSEFDPEFDTGFQIPTNIVAELCSMLLAYATEYEGYKPHPPSTIELYIESSSNAQNLQ